MTGTSLGIPAGLANLEAAGMPPRPAKIAGLLTHPAMRCNTAELSGKAREIGRSVLPARHPLLHFQPHAGFPFMSTSKGRHRPPVGSAVRLLCLLWLAGVAMRMSLLAVPPVIPLVHEELHMSETQIGLLIGLPLAMFAIAAVPGSLLIARIGTRLALILGMAIAAVAGATRGAAIDIWTLYAAAILTGFGIALMQPAMPTLVREWLPGRIALATVFYSNGMVIGAMLPPILTIPFVLPLLNGSWRLNFILWALPAVLIAIVFVVASPSGHHDRGTGAAANRSGAIWWPDWKNPLIWLLGLTFGSNNSPFFAANAFLGDYLVHEGAGHVLGLALTSLNGAQIFAFVILFLMADRLTQRAWPFLLCGPCMLAGFLGLIFLTSPAAIIICSGVIGISTALTMTPTLALPALLAAPRDVPRIAAGMFTVSYTCAIIIPTICGALWDATGKPWTAFVPLCLCAVTLGVLGAIVSRFRPQTAAATLQASTTQQ
jgi:MFS transporter, CP family, cyanate transporter